MKISGFERESHVGHRIIPDRIVSATFLCAAAATGGDIELRGVDLRQFSRLEHFLKRAGCDIISSRRSVRLISDGYAAAAYGGASQSRRANRFYRKRF